MAAVVGSKGQIVIEKALRNALGLQPGYIAVQKLVGDHIEIHFYPPEHKRSLHGILAEKIRKRIDTSDWQQVREAAWNVAIHEQTEKYRGHSDAS